MRHQTCNNRKGTTLFIVTIASRILKPVARYLLFDNTSFVLSLAFCTALKNDRVDRPLFFSISLSSEQLRSVGHCKYSVKSQTKSLAGNQILIARGEAN